MVAALCSEIGTGGFLCHFDPRLGMGRPHTPGCFGKRVCKALKTKGGSAKKSGKRVQECARDRKSTRLQSHLNLVCRLLLEKKNSTDHKHYRHPHILE